MWFGNVEIAAQTAAVVIGIWLLGHIDTRTKSIGVSFYAAAHAAVAHTLMSAKSLPNLTKVVTALAGSCTAAMTLVHLLGAGLRTRALAAGASTLLMGLTNSPFPSAMAFAALAVDNPAFSTGPLSKWWYALMPAL
eukprot:SAG31_NODE_9632_length_1249_cov_0.706957_1_plen_135_part_01